MKTKLVGSVLGSIALSGLGARQGYHLYCASRDRAAAKAPEVLQKAPKPFDDAALKESQEKAKLPVN